MSHASGAVKFNDDTIKFCEYNGAADVVCSRLYDTKEEMNEHWRKDNDANCNCGKDERVRIMNTYGGGMNWNGRACKKCMAVTNGFYPYGQEIAPWETKDWKKERLEIDLKYGEPGWSPFKQ